MHGHGFAVMYLASVYGMLTKESMREATKDAVVGGIELTARGQSGAGGLTYVPGSGDECSVTVTQVQALRAAHNSGFLVPRGTRGFSARDIHKKMSLRASITSELVLDSVRLPSSAVLPEVTGLRGPLSCLTEARFGIVWGVTGAARTCLETAVSYATTRTQFGKALAEFQLTQSKLAWMAVSLYQAQLLALHLGRLKSAGTLTPVQVSAGKMANARTAIDIARMSRTILAANGVTLEYPVIRHANNLEAVITYEGTEEIHALALGQALTGMSAYR